jgi:hypothetical protein
MSLQAKAKTARSTGSTKLIAAAPGLERVNVMTDSCGRAMVSYGPKNSYPCFSGTTCFVFGAMVSAQGFGGQLLEPGLFRVCALLYLHPAAASSSAVATEVYVDDKASSASRLSPGTSHPHRLSFSSLVASQ